MTESNEIKQVLFDPDKVGWDNGLKIAVEEAEKFGVSLACLTKSHKRRVLRKYHYIQVVVRR